MGLVPYIFYIETENMEYNLVNQHNKSIDDVALSHIDNTTEN